MPGLRDVANLGHFAHLLHTRLAATITWAPYIIIVSIASLGILTMNVPYLMLTAGIIATLITTELSGLLVAQVFHFLYGRIPQWAPPPGCSLLPPVIPGDASPRSVLVPSLWITAVVFVVTYIIRASSAVLSPGGLPPWIADGAHKTDVQAAENTAFLSIYTAGFLFVTILAYRFVVMRCESFVPTLLGIVAGVTGALLWFEIADKCPRWIADVLGITARYPPAASATAPEAQCPMTLVSA